MNVHSENCTSPAPRGRKKAPAVDPFERQSSVIFNSACADHRDREEFCFAAPLAQRKLDYDEDVPSVSAQRGTDKREAPHEGVNR